MPVLSRAEGPHNDGFNHQYATINPALSPAQGPALSRVEGGLRYHYVREGAGPPLLLIHGWPGFYYEWRLNIKPLARHFDVVVPDMRGYAYTDKPDLPPEEGYSDAAFAGDIRALLDHLGWPKASIVSHDFGAVWVQRFARTYRDMVEKLVFFDPPYPGISMRWLEFQHVPQVWYMMFHQLPWAEDLVGSSPRATEIYIRHFLSHWSYNKGLWTDEEVAAYVEAYSQPGALRGGFNCYRAMFRTLGRGAESDPRIQAPTLVLWAENDPILPLAWSDKLSEFFPNLTLRQVPQCGHFMMRERPDMVNEAVRGFLLRDESTKM